MSHFETNGLKVVYFQGGRSQALSTRSEADVFNLQCVNLHRLATDRHALDRTAVDYGIAPHDVRGVQAG